LACCVGDITKEDRSGFRVAGSEKLVLDLLLGISPVGLFRRNRRFRLPGGLSEQNNNRSAYFVLYGTRVGDEDVDPPEAHEHRLYRLLCALRVGHVCREHEHLRTRHGG
jgi:hypothetical protein